MNGLQLKEEGLDRVEGNTQRWVDDMRTHAWMCCVIKGEVTADDIRKHAISCDFHPNHSNAYGSVFRGKGWKAIGWKQSKHPSNHGRSIRVWKWVG